MSCLIKRFLLGLSILLFIGSHAQERACGKADVFYRLLQQNTQMPEDALLQEQYMKVFLLDAALIESLSANEALNIIPLAEGSNFTRHHGYLLEGLVNYDNTEKNYWLMLIFQTTCSQKVLAEVTVRFQMYPSWDHKQIAAKAIAELNSKVNIAEFETKEREARKYGLGGDLWGGKIEVTADAALAKGEETTVSFRLSDCDGTPLAGKKISTNGTAGGVFSPSSFSTNANGIAMVKFKQTTEQSAIINAQSEFKNVWGCQDLYTGSTAVKGLNAPIKVEVYFSQEDVKTLKQGTLPGIDVQGGEESELKYMFHKTVLYHYPSARALKDGFLIEAGPDAMNNGSKSIWASETGWYTYARLVKEAKFTASANGVKMIEGTEKGTELHYEGTADISHKAEVSLYLGGQGNPPSFHWSVEYPASNKGVAYGGMDIEKGEPGVIWEEKKVNDPKSPFKKVYTIMKTTDAAEELKNGNKALKELLGFNADQLAKMVDPTKEHGSMAGASGTATLIVKIWSPK